MHEIPEHDEHAVRAPDVSYDRAHDDVPEAEERPPDPEPVTVVTDTPDGGGDYSYDLAHDLPAQDRRRAR